MENDSSFNKQEDFNKYEFNKDTLSMFDVHSLN